MLISSDSQPKFKIRDFGSTQAENSQGEAIKNMQEISFKLELLNLNLNGKEPLRKIFSMIKDSIDFLKHCLKEDKFFTHNKNFVDQVWGAFSKALYTILANKEARKEEQISALTWSILSEIFGRTINRKNFGTVTKQEILKIFEQGVPIKLRVNVKDINRDDFHQIEALIGNKKQNQIAPHAAQTEHIEQTQQGTQNTTNMKVVPLRGSFGSIVAREIACKGPVVLTATRDNIPEYTIFGPLSNVLNEITRLFFLRTRKLFMKKEPKAITYPAVPQGVKSDYPVPENLNTPEGTNSSEVAKNCTKKERTSKPTLKERTKRFFGITSNKENHPENTNTTAEPTLTQAEENHTKSTTEHLH